MGRPRSKKRMRTRKRESTVPPPTPNSRRRWTEKEKLFLDLMWGSHSLNWLSKKLGRSAYGITRKAREMGLSSKDEELGMSMREFVRRSGFSNSKVKKAVSLLGMKLKRKWSTDPRDGNTTKTRNYMITDEEARKLIQVMMDHEFIRLDQVGAGKSTKGKWGVGRKPKRCVSCGTEERPHYAKGQCRSCYNKQYKKKGKKHGNDPVVGRADQGEQGTPDGGSHELPPRAAAPASTDQRDVGADGRPVGRTEDSG